MAAPRRSIALGLALVLLVAVVPAAPAGVRVVEPYSRPAEDSHPRQRHVDVEGGLGVVGGDFTTGPYGGVAVEVPAGAHFGVVVRGDFASFEQREDALFFVAVARTGMSVLSLGLRWSEQHGDARSFLEGGIGFGEFHSVLSIGPFRFADDARRACQTLGIGASWSPGRSPAGILAEARMIVFDDRDPVVVFPVRAGLQLGLGR